MFKRILPFVIVLVIAIPAILFVILTRNKTINVYQTSAIEMVPEEPMLILETRSATDLLTTVIQSAHLFPALEKAKGLISFTTAIKKLDSLVNTDNEVLGEFPKSPAVFSLHASGKDQFDFIIVIDLVNQVKLNVLKKVADEMSLSSSKWGELNYDKEKIHQLNFSGSPSIPQLSIFQTKKYLVLSPSQLLIESVIRQSSGDHSLLDDQGFQRLRQSASVSSRAILYANSEIMPGWLGQWMNTDLKARCLGFNRYGSWIEMDVSVRDDALIFSGLGFSGDTGDKYLDIFSRQEPQLVDVDAYLPASTGLFIHYGISKPAEYFEDLANHMAGTESGRHRDQSVTGGSRTIGENIVETFIGLISKDVVLAYLTNSSGEKETPVVFVGTQSRNQTSIKLMEWLGKIAVAENKELSSYTQGYQMDAEKSFSIYRTPIVGLPEILGGSLFSVIKGEYFSFVDNYLILSDQIQGIQDVIYHHELNKVLSSDPVYQASTNLISSRSNFTFYGVPHRTTGLLGEMLGKDYQAKVEDNEEFLKEIGAVGMQFHRKGDFFHNVFVKFNEMSFDRPQTVWESRLESLMDFKPVLAINHNTQAKEIVVQDASHNLYLINTSGRVLWRLPLDEKINSEVYQIDIYRNNKLQLLFSTANQLHLVDRNGNYVDKYPIRFRAPASTGMALFDYDKNEDYRILVPCSDKKVYLYDKSGDLVRGWEFGETEGTVRHPARHFRTGSRDYIVFTDELRVYILDRRGGVRVQPQQQFPVSSNNPIIFDANTGGSGSRWVITDTNGKIYSIYQNGRVEAQEIEEFSSQHFFTLVDLNSDSRDDFVFIDDNRMAVYRHDGEELFSHKFDCPILHPANIYQFSSTDIKIGIVAQSDNEIFLFNKDGSLYKGFPLAGRTPFTIGFLDPSATHFNLLVGGSDQFLYNYRVK